MTLSHLFCGSQFGPEIEDIFTHIMQICMISSRLLKTAVLRYEKTHKYIFKYFFSNIFCISGKLNNEKNSGIIY